VPSITTVDTSDCTQYFCYLKSTYLSSSCSAFTSSSELNRFSIFVDSTAKIDVKEFIFVSFAKGSSKLERTDEGFRCRRI